TEVKLSSAPEIDALAWMQETKDLMAVPVPVPVPTKALGVGDAGAAQPRVLDSEDEPPVAVAVAVAPDLCHGGGRPAAVVAVSAVTATTATLQSVEVDHGGGPVHGGPQNEDGEDEGPEEPASTEAERVRRQFENAFEVHGLKHVCDNLLGSVLAGLSFWGGLLHRLRALEVLLSRVYYRERFQAVCMDSAPPAAQSAFNDFSASLRGLRWQAVVEFVSAILPLEPHLRAHWSKQKFMTGSSSAEAEASRRPLGKWAQDAAEGPTVDNIDQAIRDEATWVQASMVLDLALESEHIGRWCETCPCPHHQPLSAWAGESGPSPATGMVEGISSETAVQQGLPLALVAGNVVGAKNSSECPYRGCRAVELACGEGLCQQLRYMLRSRDSLVRHVEACRHAVVLDGASAKFNVVS
ncbi:unnamed protein product, partial [Effrenium voratum]